MGAVADFQTYLAAQSLVDGATGWPSSRRQFHDESHQLVVIGEDGGREPEMQASDGLGDEAMKDPSVLVSVRGAPWDGDASAAKAQAIFDALHGERDVTLDATTYLRIVARTPEPVFAGQDENNRPLHTIAFRALTDIQ